MVTHTSTQEAEAKGLFQNHSQHIATLSQKLGSGVKILF